MHVGQLGGLMSIFLNRQKDERKGCWWQAEVIATMSVSTLESQQSQWNIVFILLAILVT